MFIIIFDHSCITYSYNVIDKEMSNSIDIEKNIIPGSLKIIIFDSLNDKN